MLLKNEQKKIEATEFFFFEFFYQVSKNEQKKIHLLKLRDVRVNQCATAKANMNNTKKLNVYKKVLQEVCEKFDGAEEFIREKIEGICSEEKVLSVEEVT